MNLPTKEEMCAIASYLCEQEEQEHRIGIVMDGPERYHSKRAQAMPKTAALLRAIARGDLVVCTDSGPDGWTGRYKPATSIPDEK